MTLGWEDLPGTNKLAYLLPSSVSKIRSYKTLTTEVNVTKLFSLSLTEAKKAGSLALVSSVVWSAFPSSSLISKYETSFESLARYKHSS